MVSLLIKLKYVKADSELCAARSYNWRRRIAAGSEIKLPAGKRCIVCGESKAAEEFYKEKYSANGLLSHCKVCDSKRQNSYRTKRFSVSG